MSCLSCLAKRSRVKGRGGRGEGRGRTSGRVPIVAETLSTKKIHRLLKRNHRYPCQSCILSHTQNQWDQISFAVRWYCSPQCYHHQEPLVLHVLPPWHHIQFGDQRMLSWERWDVGTPQAEYENTVYISNTNPLPQSNKSLHLLYPLFFFLTLNPSFLIIRFSRGLSINCVHAVWKLNLSHYICSDHCLFSEVQHRLDLTGFKTLSVKEVKHYLLMFMRAPCSYRHVCWQSGLL